MGCIGFLFRVLFLTGASIFVIFTGAAAVFEFVTLPFDGTFSKFITLYLIWLLSSYIVGWFIAEKMKNDEMDTTGSFVLDALIWFNVLNYKFINRFVFRRENRNSRRSPLDLT